MKKIIVIILVSLVVQAVFISFFDVKIERDAKDFDKVAQNVAKGLGLTEDGEEPSQLYPGAPLVFGGIYAIFGHRPLAVKIFQAVLFSVLCILIYGIGRSCFSENTGFVSALICALYPPLFILPDLLLSEFLFTFFLAMLVCLYILSMKRDSNLVYCLIGLVSGWLSYIRPNGFFVIFFLIAGTFILFKDKKKMLRFAVISLAFFILIMAPITIRNYIHFDKIMPVVGIEALTVNDPPEGYKPEQVEEHAKKQADSQIKLVKGYYDRAGIIIDEAQMRGELKGLLGKIIPQDYTWRPKNILDGLRRLYIGSYSDLYQIGIPLAFFFKDKRLIDAYPREFAGKMFLLSVSVLVCILGVVGFLIGIKRFNEFFPLFLVITYNTLFWLAYTLKYNTNITTRYGLPVVPYIVIFAVFGAMFLLNKLKGASNA